MREITLEELSKLDKKSYQLVDVREETLCIYGMMPGAINILPEDLNESEEFKAIPEDKKIIFYCQIGKKSKE